MKRTMDISETERGERRSRGIGRRQQTVMAFTLVCGSVVAFLLGGCAAGGYSGAYYAPDYGPYYSDYGYGGDPYYYGYDPGYYGGYAIGSTRHSRYYGSHHFAHDFGASRSPSVRTAPRTTTRTVAPSVPSVRLRR